MKPSFFKRFQSWREERRKQKDERNGYMWLDITNPKVQELLIELGSTRQEIDDELEALKREEVNE